MTQCDTVVALIPARGGSKGIPGKNIADLGGKPLIAWSIEAARATPEIEGVYVSTDDPQIALVAERYGATVLARPAELATDQALPADAIRYHIEHLRASGEEAAYMVYLEPTAPFRIPDDISACIARLRSGSCQSVATFSPAEQNPERAWRIVEGVPQNYIPGADPWQPRQALPEAHFLNGLVYGFVIDDFPANSSSVLFGTIGAVEVDARRVVDIDTPVDLQFANFLVQSGTMDPIGARQNSRSRSSSREGASTSPRSRRAWYRRLLRSANS
ncbi:MAG: acylneuraminate cytidylyltransferase family protein [Neomegalonema sp.]|nr:acylneuraminate cytidylyltransferase family protein [Neomegalonema sp.]